MQKLHDDFATWLSARVWPKGEVGGMSEFCYMVIGEGMATKEVGGVSDLATWLSARVWPFATWLSVRVQPKREVGGMSEVRYIAISGSTVKEGIWTRLVTYKTNTVGTDTVLKDWLPLTGKVLATPAETRYPCQKPSAQHSECL